MSDILTPHQSQYYAWQLTRKSASDSVESFAATLVDAQVDLNPHQVDAALFACQNPLSRGVILADEVGLGKTIEAGLVISQRWAERKRKILIRNINSYVIEACSHHKTCDTTYKKCRCKNTTRSTSAIGGCGSKNLKKDN